MLAQCVTEEKYPQEADFCTWGSPMSDETFGTQADLTHWQSSQGETQPIAPHISEFWMGFRSQGSRQAALFSKSYKKLC